MNFTITTSDPLPPPTGPDAVRAQFHAALAEPRVHLIMERDEDCPFNTFQRTLEIAFPGIELVAQDQNPRYYRVFGFNAPFGTHWGQAPFNEWRAGRRISPCGHLFRVNRHGGVYAYETPP